MKYESSFKSEADNLEISIMAVIPDKKPYRAVVQLVHGMSIKSGTFRLCSIWQSQDM